MDVRGTDAMESPHTWKQLTMKARERVLDDVQVSRKKHLSSLIES